MLVDAEALLDDIAKQGAWEAFLENVSIDEQMSRALLSLVFAALALGDTGYALDLARRAEPEYRVVALTRVAKELVARYFEAAPVQRKSLHRNISQLLGEIWGVGPWYAALDLVATFDAGLVRSIARETLLGFDADPAATAQ